MRLVPVQPYWTPMREHLFKGLPALEAAAEEPEGDWKGKYRFRIRDLFADERRTRSVFDFLRTTGVGRRTEPNGAREEAQGKESEREGEERKEGEDSGREEDEE